MKFTRLFRDLIDWFRFERPVSIKRGDVGLSESTRDPIFLLQGLGYTILDRERFQSAIDQFDPDGEDHDREFSDWKFNLTDTQIEELISSELLTSHWHTDSVWFTREEAEGYGRSHSYNYLKWRVYCVCAEGALAKILAKHSEYPTGTLRSK